MIDLRFPTALQAVLMLASAEVDGVRANSASLAEGLGANASFVRRLLAPLSRAGIVQATMGNGGGLRLARPARDITLRDIYLAATDDKRIWSARPGVPDRCFVSRTITGYFQDIAAEAEAALLETLSRRTVERALDELRALANRTEPRNVAIE